MTKNELAALAGAGLKSRLLRPLTQRFYRRRLPIVFYHGLWPNGSRMKRLFKGHDLAAFRDEMKALSGRFRFVPLEDVLALNAAGRVPEQPVMAVTFDDGHEMVRTGAIGVLEQLGIRSTLFVITGCVGNRHLMWMHALYAVWETKGERALLAAIGEVTAKRGFGPKCTSLAAFPVCLKGWSRGDQDELAAEVWREAGMPPVADYLAEHRPYFDWDELAGWMARGQDVGLHTHSHPFCSQLDAAGIEREIIAPANEVRARLGIERPAFAYPFGDRIGSAETERQVCADAGLSCMLGVRGSSRIGTAPWAIERADAEQGVDAFVYGWPMINALRGR